MLTRLALLFVVVPLAELAILLGLGAVTSLTFTMALVIATGLAGAVLARSQGVQALRRIRRDMSEGRMPTDPLVDGVLILVAGAFLLTPGILTDAVGLSLLIPPFRRRWRGGLRHRLGSRVSYGDYFSGDNSPQSPRSTKIIDSYVVGQSQEAKDKRPGE